MSGRLIALLMLARWLGLLVVQTHAWRDSGDPRDPAAVLMSSVDSLLLRRGELTTGRRSTPVPQMTCISGPRQCAPANLPTQVMCETVGGRTNDPIWKCTATLPEGMRLGTTDISCEGFRYPEDPYILRGSCGLEYTLEGTPAAADAQGTTTTTTTTQTNTYADAQRFWADSEWYQQYQREAVEDIVGMILVILVLILLITACTYLAPPVSVAPPPPPHHYHYPGWGWGWDSWGWGGGPRVQHHYYQAAPVRAASASTTTTQTTTTQTNTAPSSSSSSGSSAAPRVSISSGYGRTSRR